MYLLNGFSVSTLDKVSVVYFKKITQEQAKEYIKNKEVISAIGHESTAQILSKILDIPVEVNRISVKLKLDDEAIIITVTERLKEGEVLGLGELYKMLDEDKIVLYYARVVG